MKTKRRVIIVHGWRDSPRNAWINWLAGELEARGFEVTAPALPSAPVPNLGQWMSQLKEAAGRLDSNTVIVAHSLGTPTTLRLLNDYPENVRIAGLVLVAGFGAGFRDRPAALFQPPLDFELIASRARTRICMYSNNDRTVPPRLSKQLAVQLNARETMVMGAGHFIGNSRYLNSIDRLPAALEAVLSCYPGGLRGILRNIRKALRWRMT